MTKSVSQRRLARAFVELAASPVADPADPTGLLRALAEHGTELFDDCAAIVLYCPDGRGPAQVTGTDESLMELAREAVAWDEGPGTEARSTGTPVPDTDLSGDRARRDWPRYARRARELGYGRAAAVPLHVGADTPGALVLLGPGGTALPAELLELGQSLTDVVGWTLDRERRLAESRALADQLGQALTTRIVIEQAKGTLAASLSISVDEAFHLLRSHARSRRRRLTDVAQDVVDRRLRLSTEE
ncbi:GAF and ANTAR domain-containing protein [Streptomyces sp. MBT33]|uniref:GAF and ANTAR domain-containing protein n=1 Tax=Streptomyces sp. MBT33 TaxID=1488363 RepID=UPI00190A79D4|nr:GAF and ANTAR domain-containing protein [Streptomyces sp. MBT33]MBK3644445.1 GAF and ANTAR domain-containing protein [Streptomyces sp. MBT33]